jgi:MoaA/NifB/PqqE/SkfB family radical SAM enzyme
LELSRFCPPEISPGAFLEENFGVPLIRLNPPIGLRDNDAFLAAIKGLGGRLCPEALAQRGRYLDAMLDGHKHSALGRAGIYGDPDLVYGLVRLCLENGLLPTVAATGSVAPEWPKALLAEIEPLAATAQWPKVAAQDDADFDLIERLCLKNGVNLLVGSSEGRRLAEKRAWPLVRCAFPVHDRQGGSRVRLYGFDGATMALDNLTNAIRGQEEASFRVRLKAAYHRPTPALEEGASLALPAEATVLSGAEATLTPAAGTEAFLAPAAKAAGQSVARLTGLSLKMATASPAAPGEALAASGGPLGLHDPEALRPAWGLASAQSRTETHPCFSLEAAHDFARLHLPVAPKCNLGCRYCRRDLDCPNESRPGVCSQVLTPKEALDRFLTVREKLGNLTVVGIAGPGESLANFSEVAETLALIREHDPKVAFCLSTNGLALPYRAQALWDLGVKHLTVTVNALDPEVGAKIYREVDYLGRVYQGLDGAAILLANQLGGLKLAAGLGMKVKVNTVVLHGVNGAEAPKVAKEAAGLGATVGNVMQHIPVEGSDFGHLPQIPRAELQKLSWECQAYLPQIRHCRQCRADAAGLLGEDLSYLFRVDGQKAPLAPPAPYPAEKGPAHLARVAVATKSGIVVDQHFGQADRFLVYESDGLSLKLLENRKVDLGPGGGCGGFCGLKDPLASQKPEGFIARLVAAAADCDAAVATRVGQSPKDKLAARGIMALASYDSVDRAVLAAAREVLGQRALAAAERTGS